MGLHSSDWFAALHVYACSGIPTFFLACAVNVTHFHAMCQANFLSDSSPCCSSIKQSYIWKSNLSSEPLWCFSCPPTPNWIELLFIVLEMQHLHVPSGYGTLNNSPCITRSMLSLSVGSWERDENQAFFFFFRFSSLDREAHMVLCGLNF